MDIFLKILGSQESGYSGDTPHQRGKYILIPRECYNNLPYLEETVLNSFKPIKISCSPGKFIGANYVWHNKKYHMTLEENARDHDERRLYRNNGLDKALQLDRDVIFGMTMDNNDFSAFSLSPEHTFYNEMRDFIEDGNNRFKLCQLNDIEPQHPNLFNFIKPFIGDSDSSQEELENIEEVFDQIEKFQKRKEPPQGEFHDEDPGATLKDVITTQADFQKVIARMYEGKCALRQQQVVGGQTVGLEAAHIKAKTIGGPFSPTNGILLSTDLHRAFDRGYWTITTDLKVEVHKKVQAGTLYPFNGSMIKTVGVFKPYEEYIQWHRDNVFGNFDA
tara:strand:- start:162 stop:1160 length:999 start_codon:yes stop_codon:yes gene_type:complete